MVKTNMSRDGSENERRPDSMTKTKDKLKIQQRLIDFAARNLQSSRLSSFVSPSSGSTSHGGEGQSAIEENIRLQENKLMKGFSRQLILKHQYVKQVIEEGDEAPLPLEQVKRELDQLINLEQFLSVIGIGAKSTKALLSADLTLDVLYLKTVQELEQLLLLHGIPSEDGRTLVKYLDHLSSYYEMWERGEQPSVSSYERMGSTTSSRLSSISTLGSMDFDSRNNSMSSMTGLSPLTAHSSASTTPTPLTPSSSQSLLSPSPFTNSLTSSVGQVVVPSVPTSDGIGGGFAPYNRSHSHSSSMLLSEVESPSHSGGGGGLTHYHHSVSCLNETPKHTTASTTTGKGRNRKLTHKRSLSNPLANIILNRDSPSSSQQDQQQQMSYVPQTSTPVESATGQRSPSPPSRSGSQPLMSTMTNSGGGGSPISFHRNHRNPQLRKIAVGVPTFSQSISNDQLMPSHYSHMQASSSDACLNRQNTWQGSEEFSPMVTPRCNSLAHPPRPQSSQPIFNHEMTSTSMVDLPMTMHSISSEHLDQIDEYSLPNSGKSQSVPKLTFMNVSSDDRGVPSTSAPTSPRTPGMYTPTGHIGHAIMHRFTTKTFIAPHVCDFCKRTVMIGVKCKHCKYKCHKSCAVKAPPSCGLPRELMDYFRKQVLLTSSPSPSTENFVSPSEQNATRPRLEKSSTVGDYTDPKDPDFFIQDLTREPTKTQFSPVMTAKRSREMRENGRHRHELYSQTSTSSLLMVPHQHHLPSGYRSTSSSPSPSTSPPTSPSLTPSSPRSPNDVVGPYTGYHYSPHQNSRELVKVVFTDDSGDESYDGHITSDSRSESPLSSKEGSTQDISDFSRLSAPSPTGKRPAPQIIMAKSLPDLLNITSSTGLSEERVMDSTDGTSANVTSGYVSDDNYFGSRGQRRESLQRTLSTADSKTSTLVNSITTEEDYESDPYGGSQGEFGGMNRADRVIHRNSVVDEWSIPYENIRIQDRVGCGPVGEVYRGNWHGEVAIKRFSLPDATPEQIGRFKEEVSVLKKTRHENLALFMGASLTAPNLAIVTSFCRGHTLYKYVHVWGETFSIEKSVNIAKQIAQAVGYLHARSIVHKDLNTKNIFLEKDKVIITDTGLSTLSDSIWLHQPNIVARSHQYMVIPHTKLFYLASELVRALVPFPEVLESGDIYPYSEKTDVYAFGTVMYELLMRRFPFSTDCHGYSTNPSSIIFMVGRGKRAEMQSREVPKRIKDLVWDCWQLDPRKRLPFSTINEILIKLLRRKTPIARSPSFPISLSRSTETLNYL